MISNEILWKHAVLVFVAYTSVSAQPSAQKSRRPKLELVNSYSTVRVRSTSTRVVVSVAG